jgi:hypothetical protein
MDNNICNKNIYHMLHFNCNHFTYSIVKMICRITNRDFLYNYPKNINKIAEVFSIFSCNKSNMILNLIDNLYDITND